VRDHDRPRRGKMPALADTCLVRFGLHGRSPHQVASFEKTGLGRRLFQAIR
jgi:hypothetical protein